MVRHWLSSLTQARQHDFRLWRRAAVLAAACALSQPSCSEDGAGVPGGPISGLGGTGATGAGGIVGSGAAFPFSGGAFGSGGDAESGGSGTGVGGDVFGTGGTFGPGVGGIPGAGVGGIPGSDVGGIPGSGVGGLPSELLIDVWHGTTVGVGGPDSFGVPQRFANVIGRISSPHTVTSASYQINGGELQPLALGPNDNRLSIRGDYNVEVPIDALSPAPAENSVRIVAKDDAGTEQERRITVSYVPPTKATKPPVFLDFSKLSNLEQVRDRVALVDGLWELAPGGIHVVQMGYDRLIALGDRTWSPGYEVVAEVTVHDFRTYGGLGIAIGWQGHSGNASPRTGWPLEALGWVRFRPEGPRTQIMTYEKNEIAEGPATMTPDTTYVYRVRSQRLSGGQARFSVKCWPADAAEPSAYQLERDVPGRSGSVLLVAHHADVTWKTVRVTPVPDGN